jgi:hypothetical protein
MSERNMGREDVPSLRAVASATVIAHRFLLPAAPNEMQFMDCLSLRSTSSANQAKPYSSSSPSSGNPVIQNLTTQKAPR